MSNKQLIIVGGLALAGVALYLYWKSHKSTVVNPNPTATVTPPTTSTNIGGSGSATTQNNGTSINDYINAGKGAWDAISNIFGGSSSSDQTAAG